MPRPRILNATEREARDKPPALNAAERRRAFDMPSSLTELAASVRDPAQRIGFLVSAVCFVGARRFFSPRDCRARDVVCAARRRRLPPDLFEPDFHAARTRQRHEIAVLQAHRMHRLDREREAELVIDIDAMAATHLRPKLIFWRCLDLLAQRRVRLPREHRLTALIAFAMARRKQQLVERVEMMLTPELRPALDSLFAAAGDGTQDTGPGRGSGRRDRLIFLKKLTQSTGAKDVPATSLRSRRSTTSCAASYRRSVWDGWASAVSPAASSVHACPSCTSVPTPTPTVISMQSPSSRTSSRGFKTICSTRCWRASGRIATPASASARSASTSSGASATTGLPG